MVKTIISTIVAFIILFGISFLEQFYVNKTFNELKEQMTIVFEKIENDVAVKEDVLSVQKFWISKKENLHIFIPHNDIKEIDLWLSESSTLVENGKKEEAMSYFSTKVAEVVDYEELEGYLKDLKEYYCFAEDEGKGIRRVSVAKKNKKDEEIFSFRMVAEPDSFGKWKIFSIEREGKE